MGVWKSQLAYREGVGQPHIYFCDLASEMPASGLLTGADILFCHEDKYWYVASSSTQWAAAATGEGGGPHTHQISQVTDLQTALDGKSDVGHTHAGASIPAGCILMWHGLLSNIPGGFVLCDGQNGTPDLRGMFLKGAAAGEDPGDTGGSNTHSHDDHAALSHSGAAVGDHASHTHTYTQVPNHVHGFTNLRGATAGGATTNFGGVTAGADTSSAATPVKTADPDGGVATGTTAGPSATLTHSVTQPSDHAAQPHSSASNEPAYYTIAFIMKT